MSILAAFMVPHPPMIVPAVGRGSEAQIMKTTGAYERVAEGSRRRSQRSVRIRSSSQARILLCTRTISTSRPVRAPGEISDNLGLLR